MPTTEHADTLSRWYSYSLTQHSASVSDNTRTAPLATAFWQHDITDHAIETSSLTQRNTTEKDAISSLVASTLRFAQLTHSDLVKLTVPGHYQVADHGVHATWEGDPSGQYKVHSRPIQAARDWQSLSSELTPTEQRVITAAAQLRSVLPKQIPLFATVFLPATQCQLLCDENILRTHLTSAHQQVERGLAQLTQQTKQLIDALSASRVDGIYLVSKHHNQHYTPETYQRYWANSDQTIFEHCERFTLNILHLHGDALRFQGLPETGRWWVHYAMTDANPPAATFRQQCHWPAVIGLPASHWDAPPLLQSTVSALLQDLQQNWALLTCPCVVPLAIPATRIARWATTGKSI